VDNAEETLIDSFISFSVLKIRRYLHPYGIASFTDILSRRRGSKKLAFIFRQIGGRQLGYMMHWFPKLSPVVSISWNTKVCMEGVR